MSKKVLILSGSPRKGGNSDLLCDEFMRGAQEAGNEVEKIRVVSKKIAPCSACYFCRSHHGECAHKDDMAEVLQKMIDADVIVLSSPVYFYSIDAQLKAVIDRTVARWLEVKIPPPLIPRWRASAAMSIACMARWKRGRLSETACMSRVKSQIRLP